jgi:hypothetical protein
VTAEGAFTPDSDIDRIFGPVVHAQTYRQLAYALLAFPLGLLYFVSMVCGLSIGIGTAVIVVGFLILALTLWAAVGFARIERALAQALLGAVFDSPAFSPSGLRALLKDRRAWRIVIYLILHLPLGIAGLVSSVLMLSAIPAMAAPVLYLILPLSVDGRLASWDETMLVALFGCVFFLLAAHAVNAVAAVARRLAVALL